MALIGPSGCGKTTTLKMLNRLLEPTAGEIEILGRNILDQDPIAVRRQIGYVIQGGGLFPHWTVARNIGLAPTLLDWPPEHIDARVQELLELVGLEPAEYRGRYPIELSGGQRQRVGIARALAADPPVVLLDEPFSALDAITRRQMQQEFLRLNDSLHKTMILVTHDLDEAFLLADQVLLMPIARRAGQHEIAPFRVSENIFNALHARQDLHRLGRRLTRCVQAGKLALEPRQRNHPQVRRAADRLEFTRRRGSGKLHGGQLRAGGDAHQRPERPAGIDVNAAGESIDRARPAEIDPGLGRNRGSDQFDERFEIRLGSTAAGAMLEILLDALLRLSVVNFTCRLFRGGAAAGLLLREREHGEHRVVLARRLGIAGCFERRGKLPAAQLRLKDLNGRLGGRCVQRCDQAKQQPQHRQPDSQSRHHAAFTQTE